MTTSLRKGHIQTEARLMAVLIDALHHEGVLHETHASRWVDARDRLDARGDYDAEAEELYDLLHQSAATGVLSGTWIESRWHGLRARVHGT